MTDAVDSKRTAQLTEEGEIAADYLEELLDIADLDGDIELDVRHGRASVEVVAEEASSLSALVGENGEVLEALQDLTRLAVQAVTGDRSWLMMDIGGYRAARRRELTEIATTAIETVRSTGNDVEMEPANAFERKVVHDVVAHAGLVSDSRGEEPYRYVVIKPASAAE